MHRFNPAAAVENYGKLKNQKLQGTSWQAMSVFRAGSQATGITPPPPISNSFTRKFSMPAYQTVQHQAPSPFEIQKGSPIEISISKESKLNHRARFWRPAVVHICRKELVSRFWMSPKNMSVYLFAICHP